jgi:Sec-independent protein translocase protein TatA
MLGGMAGPAGQMIGEARTKADEASIAEHRSRSERASERAEDAGEQAQRTRRSTDASLDALRELLRTQRETASALLSRG